MLKKACLLCFLLVFGFLAIGCSTVSKGSVGLVKGTTSGISEGAKDDWAWLLKVDKWVKNNLW